jgi:hypothetical protein
MAKPIQPGLFPTLVVATISNQRLESTYVIPIKMLDYIFKHFQPKLHRRTQDPPAYPHKLMNLIGERTDSLIDGCVAK